MTQDIPDFKPIVTAKDIEKLRSTMAAHKHTWESAYIMLAVNSEGLIEACKALPENSLCEILTALPDCIEIFRHMADDMETVLARLIVCCQALEKLPAADGNSHPDNLH